MSKSTLINLVFGLLVIIMSAILVWRDNTNNSIIIIVLVAILFSIIIQEILNLYKEIEKLKTLNRDDILDGIKETIKSE